MKLRGLSKPILRIAMSLIFLYFGIQQVISPENWIGFIPDLALNIGLTAKTLVLMNAALELILGTFLLIGLLTRFSALILSLHLFVIAFSIGFNPLGVRDFGLAIATLIVCLNNADKLCVDRFWNKKIEENIKVQ